MKIQRGLALCLIGIACVLLFACATYPRFGSEALVGNWTNSFGTIWTIKNNGAFDVDLNHDDNRDAWGNYTVVGDTMTILETGGTMPAGCKGNGVYRFTRGRDTLRFTRLHDDCKLRVKNVLLVWHRK
jgi:hypothetical protein